VIFLYSWFLAATAWLRAQYIALPAARNVLSYHGVHTDETRKLFDMTRLLAVDSALLFKLRAELISQGDLHTLTMKGFNYIGAQKRQQQRWLDFVRVVRETHYLSKEVDKITRNID